MDSTTLPPFVQALLDPAAHGGAATEHRQTHISHVILAGDTVYKFKKPVNFGFLDFSTLEKRQHFCHEELRLNRRLCPDIYQEVVEVRERDGAFAIGGPGEVVEYGVRMARMPEERMMAHVIARGGLRMDHLQAVTRALVPFYQAAEGGEEVAAFGRAEAVAVNVIENFDQTREFIGADGLGRERFERIEAWARDFLAREEIFEERIREGRIRDCHGDLYSANICLDEPVHIFDCIEFNQRFRCCDVAADIAFLAMDLDFHGLEDLSRDFVEHFAAASRDSGLAQVLGFYKCYRAYVRGKIGLFTAADPAVPGREAILEQAGRYFALAERYTRD